MRVLLVSTYEMGRQPFGLASAAALLGAAGHQVECADLAVGPFQAEAVRRAGLAALHLPMHTATRLAISAVARLRQLNPSISLCAFGLYAPLNAELLRDLGFSAILGGEFEAALCRLAAGGDAASPTGLERIEFRVPDRSGLPPLDRYAALVEGDRKVTAGYTEASRGCKHLCRHCPVVPVYGGRFRAVPVEVVLADVRQQVAAGAAHITFGDPDFWNGPLHAGRVVEQIHAEFPGLTYDVTIKVEHLLRHRELLPVLCRTGCRFITSAVESLDDRVLGLLDKGHTRADFFEAVALLREHGLNLAPTFIAFHPWTTIESYRDLLNVLRELHLVEAVAPVQLALRLLVPQGSLLIDLDEMRPYLREFDRASLTWRWQHPDADVDQLARDAFRAVQRAAPRTEIFRDLWALVHGQPAAAELNLLPRAAIPYLNEPWYC